MVDVETKNGGRLSQGPSQWVMPFSLSSRVVLFDWYRQLYELDKDNHSIGNEAREGEWTTNLNASPDSFI